MGKSRNKHRTFTTTDCVDSDKETNTPGKYLSPLLTDLNLSRSREAEDHRQHAGERQNSERQLCLLQPEGPHPHRAAGPEAEQDRDPETGHLIHPAPRRTA